MLVSGPQTKLTSNEKEGILKVVEKGSSRPLISFFTVDKNGNEKSYNYSPEEFKSLNFEKLSLLNKKEFSELDVIIDNEAGSLVQFENDTVPEMFKTGKLVQDFLNEQ